MLILTYDISWQKQAREQQLNNSDSAVNADHWLTTFVTPLLTDQEQKHDIKLRDKINIFRPKIINHTYTNNTSVMNSKFPLQSCKTTDCMKELDWVSPPPGVPIRTYLQVPKSWNPIAFNWDINSYYSIIFAKKNILALRPLFNMFLNLIIFMKFFAIV